MAEKPLALTSTLAHSDRVVRDGIVLRWTQYANGEWVLFPDGALGALGAVTPPSIGRWVGDPSRVFFFARSFVSVGIEWVQDLNGARAWVEDRYLEICQLRVTDALALPGPPSR